MENGEVKCGPCHVRLMNLSTHRALGLAVRHHLTEIAKRKLADSAMSDSHESNSSKNSCVLVTSDSDSEESVSVRRKAAPRQQRMNRKPIRQRSTSDSSSSSETEPSDLRRSVKFKARRTDVSIVKENRVDAQSEPEVFDVEVSTDSDDAEIIGNSSASHHFNRRLSSSNSVSILSDGPDNPEVVHQFKKIPQNGLSSAQEAAGSPAVQGATSRLMSAARETFRHLPAAPNTAFRQPPAAQGTGTASRLLPDLQEGAFRQQSDAQKIASGQVSAAHVAASTPVQPAHEAASRQLPAIAGWSTEPAPILSGVREETQRQSEADVAGPSGEQMGQLGWRVKAVRVDVKEEHWVIRRVKRSYIPLRNIRKVMGLRLLPISESVRFPSTVPDLACPNGCGSRYTTDQQQEFLDHIVYKCTTLAYQPKKKRFRSDESSGDEDYVPEAEGDDDSLLEVNPELGLHLQVELEEGEDEAVIEETSCCPRCGLKLLAWELEAHMRFVHYPFSCMICSHRYSVKTDLEDHIINDHATHFMSGLPPLWRNTRKPTEPIAMAPPPAQPSDIRPPLLPMLPRVPLPSAMARAGHQQLSRPPLLPGQPAGLVLPPQLQQQGAHQRVVLQRTDGTFAVGYLVSTVLKPGASVSSTLVHRAPAASAPGYRPSLPLVADQPTGRPADSRPVQPGQVNPGATAPRPPFPPPTIANSRVAMVVDRDGAPVPRNVVAVLDRQTGQVKGTLPARPPQVLRKTHMNGLAGDPETDPLALADVEDPLAF